MKNAEELLIAYKNGTCTEEEKQLVEKWFLFHGAGKRSDLSAEDFANAEDMTWTKIAENRRQRLPQRRRLGLQIAAAAIFILITFVGILYVMKPSDEVQSLAVHDIAPGGNKAVLRLADGTRISLTDAVKGQLISNEGAKVMKEDDGKVVYSHAEDQRVATHESHEISTPRGGKFEIMLPDGTKVWLNAATSIVFPASFEGLAERRVKLSGEAYFEVKHNARVPFRVDMGEQVIEVLGTHFNANNYPDEQAMRTTLLEGSVKVSKSGADNKSRMVFLSPGEQALLAGGTFNVKRVDAQSFTEWTNNVFSFQGQDVQAAMRQMARWYDVEVEYQGKRPSGELTGYISRAIPISKMFKMMEEISDMRFVLKGRKVLVSLNK